MKCRAGLLGWGRGQVYYVLGEASTRGLARPTHDPGMHRCVKVARPHWIGGGSLKRRIVLAMAFKPPMMGRGVPPDCEPIKSYHWAQKYNIIVIDWESKERIRGL